MVIHAAINALCISILLWKISNQVKVEKSKLTCLGASPSVKMMLNLWLFLPKGSLNSTPIIFLGRVGGGRWVFYLVMARTGDLWKLKSSVRK